MSQHQVLSRACGTVAASERAAGRWQSISRAALGVALILAAGTTGCTLVGEGEGEVTSSQLTASECWNGAFDLQPDFFTALPFRDTMQIRVQRGSDLQEVSDGLDILVNDVPAIREGQLNDSLDVGLPLQLINEIAPGAMQDTSPPVSMSLYLMFSCHNQNTVLYAVSGSITFVNLFSGDPNETKGDEKLTDAFFDVQIGDPRNADPLTLEFEPGETSPLTGWFRFHFQRGQPGQPFP